MQLSQRVGVHLAGGRALHGSRTKTTTCQSSTGMRAPQPVIRHLGLNRCQPLVRRVVVQASVDPWEVSDGIYRAGKPFKIHDKPSLSQFTASPKLTVLMCKSSHCRPCKKFASTYHLLASTFSDCQFLEIVGDESPDTRQMMKDMAVKVTPTFFIYRAGQQVHTMTGTSRNSLRRAVLDRLGPDEAGRDAAMDTATDSEDE